MENSFFEVLRTMCDVCVPQIQRREFMNKKQKNFQSGPIFADFESREREKGRMKGEKKENLPF